MITDDEILKMARQHGDCITVFGGDEYVFDEAGLCALVKKAIAAHDAELRKHELVYFWRDKGSEAWHQCNKQYQESVSKFPKDYDIGVMFVDAAMPTETA